MQYILPLYLAILLQPWQEAEAGGEAEEVVGGVEEGDPMLRVKAAMSLGRSSKSDQRWVRPHGYCIMIPWRSWPVGSCLSNTYP